MGSDPLRLAGRLGRWGTGTTGSPSPGATRPDGCSFRCCSRRTTQRMEEDTCAPPASDGKRAAWRSCVGRRSPRACRRALAPLTVANSPKWARGNAAPDTPTRCAARARGESEGGRGTLSRSSRRRASPAHLPGQATARISRRTRRWRRMCGSRWRDAHTRISSAFAGKCVMRCCSWAALRLRALPRSFGSTPTTRPGGPSWVPRYRSTAAEKSNVCPAKEPTSTFVAAMSDTLHAAVATAPASWKWSCRLKAGVGASDAARMPYITRLRRSGAPLLLEEWPRVAAPCMPHSVAVEPLSLQDARRSHGTRIHRGRW